MTGVPRATGEFRFGQSIPRWPTMSAEPAEPIFLRAASSSLLVRPELLIVTQILSMSMECRRHTAVGAAACSCG